MTGLWISRADRLIALPPYVFARLDELKARTREQGLASIIHDDFEKSPEALLAKQSGD